LSYSCWCSFELGRSSFELGRSVELLGAAAAYQGERGDRQRRGGLEVHWHDPRAARAAWPLKTGEAGQ
jgi:hypothetical protein